MAAGNVHKNLVKFGRAVFELCERTDRQTDRRHTHHNPSQPYRGEVKTRSHPEMVGDMSRVTLKADLSKIPFVHF